VRIENRPLPNLYVAWRCSSSALPKSLPVAPSTRPIRRRNISESLHAIRGLAGYTIKTSAIAARSELGTMSTSKSYDEIIDFVAAGTSPEAVVAFRPSAAVQRRVEELVERSKEGTHRCEYCFVHEDDSYSPHQVDHISSRKHGGLAIPENLA
jgi:hypothetical protein